MFQGLRGAVVGVIGGCLAGEGSILIKGFIVSFHQVNIKCTVLVGSWGKGPGLIHTRTKITKYKLTSRALWQIGMFVELVPIK